jgi:endonuclease/exonuclease/phosphatase family metal-dependent hydrolase
VKRNPLLPRLGLVVALGAMTALGLRGGGCFEPPLRVGTFNIELLGASGKTTDLDRTAALIASTEADVLGVQEIMNLRTARALLRKLPRRFALAISKCGGSGKMRVGYFYDPARVRLVSTTEHQDLAPEPSETCDLERRPGLSAKFERVDTGRAFQLLVFHLVPYEEGRVARREQWKRAHVIAAKLANETPVAILGDANSTGFLDDAGGERTFILDEAKQANMEVVTAPLGCSEYWRRDRNDAKEPLKASLLDHIVATPGLARRGSTKLWGYCAALACRVPSEDPEDFKTVSDHCPITIDL